MKFPNVTADNICVNFIDRNLIVKKDNSYVHSKLLL